MKTIPSDTDTTPTVALPDLLTLTEAADAARVTVKTISRWIADGRLPIVRMGRRVLIRRDTFAAFVDATTETATSGPLAGRKA